MIQPTTTAALSRRLATAQATGRLPSLAAGVVREGALVWSGARGTLDGRADGTAADADTQYRIGSITKTFVAVAVLRLRDEGLLDLDDRLEEHLPGTEAGRATIAHLLAHSSGLQAETDGAWWERTPGGGWDDLVAAGVALRHRPGRRFHYSNVGFAALGEVVARIRGRSWLDVVTTELLQPLGMTRTSARPEAPHATGLAVHPFADVVLPEPAHDAGALAPAGQLWSTVDDLARWAAFVTSGGDVLSADTLAEMFEPRVIDDTPGAPWTTAHGLGFQVWNVAGRRFVGHGGSMPGFLAALRIDVESGDGVVAFANSTAGLVGPLAAELLTDLATAEPVAPPEWHADASGAGAPLDLVGPWYWGPARLDLFAAADGWVELRPTVGGGRASRFRPTGDDTWEGLDGYYAGEPLRVVRRADGSVDHLDIASFVFTRTPYDADADVPGGVDPAGWR